MNYLLKKEDLAHLCQGGTLELPSGDKIALADEGIEQIRLAVAAASLNAACGDVNTGEVRRISD